MFTEHLVPVSYCVGGGVEMSLGKCWVHKSSQLHVNFSSSVFSLSSQVVSSVNLDFQIYTSCSLVIKLHILL